MAGVFKVMTGRRNFLDKTIHINPITTDPTKFDIAKSSMARLIAQKLTQPKVPANPPKKIPLRGPFNIIPKDTLAIKLKIICSINSRSEEHTSELQSRFDLVCR